MQIIALANLRNKATHSAQTVLSHFRRDGNSQTWLPKAAAVQTQVGCLAAAERVSVQLGLCTGISVLG